MIRIPRVTIPAKIAKSFIFTTFFNKIIEGSERAVTAIIKDNAVPIPTPFNTKASAIGKVPKISAYIGTPTIVANNTEYHLSWPRTADMMFSGIQLWMAAPIPTPMRIYSQTF